MRRAIVLSLIFLLPATPINAQGPVVELGAVLFGLQQLKAQLDSVVNTVDQETAAKIRQGEIALNGVIASVNDAIARGYGFFNNTRDQVMGNVATVMIQTQAMVQDTAAFALLGVNDSLANVARILTAIPGVNVPTYIYALTPLRFSRDAADVHVEAHGFFPDLSRAHPVTVHFENGQTISLDSYINNTLGFDLPKTLLSKQETFVTMTFDLPVRHLLGAYYSTLPLKARVYIERDTPFTFAVSVDVGNPKQWATVKAPAPLHERADSSRTTNNQTFTAAEIFSRLINNNVDYDMSTAQFVAIDPPPAPPPVALPPGLLRLGAIFSVVPRPAPPIIDQGSNPCASGCTSSSGTWSWDANTLRIALSAPECAPHVVSPPGLQLPYQCAGGTHADFTAFPTFRVRTRGPQLPEIASINRTLNLRRKKVSEPIELPFDWTSIEIRSQFRDGKESAENHARLTSGPTGLLSANDPIFWKAEVTGQSLIISTR